MNSDQLTSTILLTSRSFWTSTVNVMQQRVEDVYPTAQSLTQWIQKWTIYQQLTPLTL